TVVYGGAGNDTLQGGAGNDVLVGGDGDDLLTGNAGRDLLVGGFGRDTLAGGAGDDVLVGGEYQDAYNLDAVAAVLAAWAGTSSYGQRVADLRAGVANGLYPLNTTAVLDDAMTDRLTGGGARGRVRASPAELPDRG